MHYKRAINVKIELNMSYDLSRKIEVRSPKPEVTVGTEGQTGKLE